MQETRTAAQQVLSPFSRQGTDLYLSFAKNYVAPIPSSLDLEQQAEN